LRSKDDRDHWERKCKNRLSRIGLSPVKMFRFVMTCNQ